MITKKKMPLFDEDTSNLLEFVEKKPYNYEEISKRRRMLLKKYNELYGSDSNKRKQQHFILFMNENINSENMIEANSNTYTKIARLISLFRQNKTDEEKYLEVSYLYKTPEKLWNAYRELVVPLINDSIILEIHNIYKFYKQYEDSKKEKLTECDNEQELIKYLEKVREYVKYYDYSRFIINTYIEDENGYMFDEFLDRLGINRSIFNYCIKVINELDVDLYRKYETIHKENIIRKYMTYKEIFESIINGIKTGYLIDGTPFDLVTFWKLSPFVNSEVAVEEFREFKTIEEDLDLRAPGYLQKVRNFVKVTNPEELPTLNKFLYENKISRSIEKVNLKGLNEYKNIVNGREITEDDNKKIIEYMINNDIPLIKNAYIAVRNKYLNNELNLEEKITRKSMKKTLIP